MNTLQRLSLCWTKTMIFATTLKLEFSISSADIYHGNI